MTDILWMADADAVTSVYFSCVGWQHKWCFTITYLPPSEPIITSKCTHSCKNKNKAPRAFFAQEIGHLLGWHSEQNDETLI